MPPGGEPEVRSDTKHRTDGLPQKRSRACPEVQPMGLGGWEICSGEQSQGLLSRMPYCGRGTLGLFYLSPLFIKESGTGKPLFSPQIQFFLN